MFLHNFLYFVSLGQEGESKVTNYLPDKLVQMDGGKGVARGLEKRKTLLRESKERKLWRVKIA